MSEIHRTCRLCLRAFVIGVEEQATLQAIAKREPTRVWVLPSVCFPCRQLRRAHREMVTEDTPADVPLVCCQCGSTFTLRQCDIAFYTARNFRTPRRCPRCRPTRDRHPETLRGAR